MANHKDENPQLFKFKVVESGANTFTEGHKETPVLISGASEGTYVMEILRIFYSLVAGDGADQDSVSIALYDRTRAALPGLSDDGVLLQARRLATVVTEGSNDRETLKMADFTDGAGNGILYGKRNMYAAIQCASQSGAQSVEFSILYRLKKVSPMELVGIIES